LFLLYISCCTILHDGAALIQGSLFGPDSGFVCILEVAAGGGGVPSSGPYG
jgi:hypothetical protein